jgi:hypothetical protein
VSTTPPNLQVFFSYDHPAILSLTERNKQIDV